LNEMKAEKDLVEERLNAYVHQLERELKEKDEHFKEETLKLSHLLDQVNQEKQRILDQQRLSDSYDQK